MSVVAIGMILIPAFRLIDKANQRAKLTGVAQSTQIDVREYEDVDDSGTHIDYVPYYHYMVNGREYVCKSELGGDPNNGRNTVYYDPKNPAVCMTQYTEENVFYDYMFLWIGVFILAIGILAVVKTKKQGKQLF